MSEPKTVNRELGRALANPFLSRVRKVLESSKGGRRILDYHIIPGANAVVTLQRLLAAGHAYEAAHKAALDTNDYEAGLIVGARAALEAAGMVVVEVVGEFDDPEGGGPMLWDGKEWHAIGDGDRVAIIKRATTVSHSKEE